MFVLVSKHSSMEELAYLLWLHCLCYTSICRVAMKMMLISLDGLYSYMYKEIESCQVRCLSQNRTEYVVYIYCITITVRTFEYMRNIFGFFFHLNLL